jgi:hypothetical protein
MGVAEQKINILLLQYDKNILIGVAIVTSPRQIVQKLHVLRQKNG